MSYKLKIDPKTRAGGRFIGASHKALLTALLKERDISGLTQQELARRLGVHRSVVSRLIKGDANLTFRSVGEIAWAMGWDAQLLLKRIEQSPGSNFSDVNAALKTSGSNVTSQFNGAGTKSKFFGSTNTRVYISRVLETS
jgi:transcriptional regulator with XRE-family HTH domain